MKILVCGDVHWCNYSSILRKRGTEYSKRLENCINSVNWVEQTAEENNCDRVIYLGDFFDRSDLNAEETSALREVQWSNLHHDIIVGNHEIGRYDGEYNTTNILSLLPNFKVISKPTVENYFGRWLVFIPYVFENDRKPFVHYTEENGVAHKDSIVFSHNDIKGINYGAFTSKEGFEINEINNGCAKMFNGHIHNGSSVSSTLINVGNLTGQNFNENSRMYSHNIYIVDTETTDTVAIENPYSFNFYKEEVNTEKDFDKMINSLKNRSVVSIKCKESILQFVKDSLSNCKKVEEFRVIAEIENDEEESKKIREEVLSVDHLEQFKNYIIDKIGGSEPVLKELQEVIGANKI